MESLPIHTFNTFLRYICGAGICVLIFASFCSLGLYIVRRQVRYRQKMQYYRALGESLLHFQHVSASERQT
ncbi:hypothetical protein KDA_63220 [Dictyobacter alpinus]|uniref:Uncharacterized protein n=1 Tax=Dictyobacter alpinus TaxID=2014873 RepID=A0A402BHE0_9CHLR|nr:hypothetical protein KDA_63220 [Dictyobacter alpinus]